ncbi:MAG: chemotaxis response regulator protein-glutamate methylesterase [Bacillota bacterium]|nr:chemotaxis response regulator protein-glutamate methylesterase [Bacillota bacterium]
MTMKKIKVLVVDDSILYREFISKAISADPGIEVVATATDPYDARDKIVKYQPDVMTLDVEMPKMNGIEFLRKLMPQYPLPVIVISALNENVFDALNAGAVEFVAKPDMKADKSIESYINELVIKIKIASTANLSQWKMDAKKVISHTIMPHWENKIIAIGASTGGTEAILAILESLPNDMPGIVIVQHMPPVFTKMYAQRLDNSVGLHVKEAQTGDIVQKGCVLIAPGDQHMKVVKLGSTYKVECFKGEKVNGHCPSVDVLFQSVAQEAGKDAIGVILTGMGYDGAKGLLAMRRNGARTAGQNEQSSVVYGMPKVAYDLGAVEQQASLENIPQIIYSFLNLR